jgi:hypothetical protein
VKSSRLPGQTRAAGGRAAVGPRPAAAAAVGGGGSPAAGWARRTPGTPASSCQRPREGSARYTLPTPESGYPAWWFHRITVLFLDHFVCVRLLPSFTCCFGGHVAPWWCAFSVSGPYWHWC